MSSFVMPQISSYGEYSSQNYGLNAMRVAIGHLSLYFSYQTVVAFCTPETGLVVSENIWGTTTGKHLNWIDGGEKSTRTPRIEFEKMLAEVLQKVNL